MPLNPLQQEIHNRIIALQSNLKSICIEILNESNQQRKNELIRLKSQAQQLKLELYSKLISSLSDVTLKRQFFLEYLNDYFKFYDKDIKKNQCLYELLCDLEAQLGDNDNKPTELGLDVKSNDDEIIVLLTRFRSIIEKFETSPPLDLDPVVLDSCTEQILKNLESVSPPQLCLYQLTKRRNSSSSVNANYEPDESDFDKQEQKQPLLINNNFTLETFSEQKCRCVIC